MSEYITKQGGGPCALPMSISKQGGGACMNTTLVQMSKQ